MRLRLTIHLAVLVLALALPTAGLAAADRSDDGGKPAPTAVALPSPGDEAVAIALRYLGVPYSWAGASPAGFDCSGFVVYVFGKLGIELPHSTWMLWDEGRPVSRTELEPGDVVFFNGVSHVGIYVGGGSFVHAPHTGDVVRISRFSEDWYGSTYDGARRYR